MATGAFCSSRLCAATDDPRDPGSLRRARSAARPRRAAAYAALLLALVASCRVYREDAPPRDVPAGEAAPGTSAEREPPHRESDDGLKPGANEALNLWVLNRSEGDLAPYTGERPDGPGNSRAVERPRATVLVALGLGESGPDCAEQLAKRAADALASGTEPLLIVSGILELARRFRWASAPGELSAIVKGPRGVFGGVERVPKPAFAASLRRALERRAVLDGNHPRWRGLGSESSVAADLPAGCESASGAELTGPSGVLLRTHGGQIFGGVVSLAPPADAGVVSLAAQYGVSLAVGAAGAVLLASDCAVPPDERFAARVYASQSWTQATADISPPSGCRAANALATRAHAWATPGDDLVWSTAELEPTPPARAAPFAPDAGATPWEPPPQ